MNSNRRLQGGGASRGRLGEEANGSRIAAGRESSSSKLGIAEDEAFTHGMSSMGPWVLSSISSGAIEALLTALLEERELPSLLGIWTKLTAKGRTA